MLSEFRSTLITWDKATSRIYAPVTANESDENGRKVVVQVINSGQVEDLTGTSLHLYWITTDKRHTGLDVFKAVDLKKGTFELSYTTGMLSNRGVLNANLVLVDTTGRVVSERFKITVKEGIDNGAIQSENSFSSLTQALIDISNLEQNYAPRLNDLTAQLQQTNAQVDLLNRGLGETFSTLTELQSAYPTGDTKDHIVASDGHRYFWNETTVAWEDGGTYQAMEVANGSITMEKLANESLETLPIKIPSKNLFDKSKVTTGFIWDVNSGAKWPSASYSISDYIAMTANTLITTYKCVRVIEWTSDKTYIKGTSLLSGTTLVITTSPTTAYITIDTRNVDLDTTQVELGGTYTGYTPFKLGLNPTDIFDSSIPNSKLTVETQAYLAREVPSIMDIILPTTVYATVGREFNIYYRNVMLTDTNIDDYDIMISVSKGELMDDRYSFTPVSGDIGSFVAQFYIRDKKGNNLLRKDVTIEVVADITPATAKKVIFIGDSLTDDGSNGSYIETLKNMMGSRLELLGTRGTAPYLHEGRGGWSTVTYLTNTTTTNKFWNPATLAFDFTYYMTQQGYASVDDVVIFIGTNDLGTNIETLITNLKTIRTSILAFNESIQVHFVLTPPPSSSFYAFGRSRLFQWDVENKFKGFNKRYITEFAPNVVPVNLNLDPWHDFPKVAITRSQRNPETYEVVEERYHPAQVGYDKFADVLYSYFMKMWA